MSRGKAITLAVFTIWPILYMILFMGAMFTMMALSFSGTSPSSEPPIMMIILPLHFLTMLEIFVMIIIYIIHIFKTEKVPQDKKALWAVVIFLGNMIAMPIYWYLYIWKQEAE